MHPTLKQIDVRIEEAFFKDTKILCEGSWAAEEPSDRSVVRRPLEQFARRRDTFRGFLLNFTRFRQLRGFLNRPEVGLEAADYCAAEVAKLEVLGMTEISTLEG